MSDGARLYSLLEGQLSRFEQVLNALEANGAMEHTQNTFSDLAGALSDATEAQIDERMAMFAEALASTLKDHGVSEREARWAAARVRRNLRMAILHHAEVDVARILQQAIVSWRAHIEGVRYERRVARAKVVGYARVAVAGGSIVFDGVKFATLAPAPGFLFASFLAGAMLFFQGVDGILQDAG